MTKREYLEYGATVTEYRDLIGELHRLDGPAVETSRGYNAWLVHGQRHRVDGPAIESRNGGKEWWVNGELYRLDGPAIEQPNGYKAWYVNSKRHRLDGPAIDCGNGIVEWILFGRYQHHLAPRTKQFQRMNHVLKLTILQNKSRKFNEWLFDPKHYAGRWHKKNMLRDFQDS